ncbi:MAG: Flp pilus assembly protein CpaB [Candidatus Aquicultor sp.]
MKPRLVIIIIAVILGAIVTLGVNNYLNNIKKQAVEEQKTVQVWVAASDIAKGTSIEDIAKDHLAELKEIPRRYVASQAISSTRNIEGQVLSVSISAGEQLTIGKFKHPSEAGLSFTVPKGYLAVSIPYDSIRGIAEMAKPGDLVTAFASFNPGADGDDVTKILLQKVQVIAVGDSIGAEKEAPGNKVLDSSKAESTSDKSNKTITLALIPADAEKLVYAQENGKVWLGLHTSTNPQMVSTKGITIKTVFK